MYHQMNSKFILGKDDTYSLRNFGFLYRMDCTLRELMSLIKEVNPDTRQKGTLFAFSTVYPDQRRYILRV